MHYVDSAMGQDWHTCWCFCACSSVAVIGTVTVSVPEAPAWAPLHRGWVSGKREEESEGS